MANTFWLSPDNRNGYQYSSKVKVVFMSKDDSLTVKLLEPTDATSPVFDLSRRGDGLHHLSFRCDDINAELVRFKELNLRILAAPQPG